MLMGTPTPLNTNTHPDYIAIALVAILAIIVVALVLRKYLSNRNASTVAENAEEVNESTSSVQTAPGSAGNIKLNNVSPKTAAMIMAIVADELGKPLNELRFISVKEITNDEI